MSAPAIIVHPIPAAPEPLSVESLTAIRDTLSALACLVFFGAIIWVLT